MHNGLKLLTGLAATVVVAQAGMMVDGYTIIARLNAAAMRALLAEGVADGSANVSRPGGLVGRIAYVSGTADAATRAAVLARLRRHPGIEDARWVPR